MNNIERSKELVQKRTASAIEAVQLAGERIRRYRRDQGMPRTELSRRTGVSTQSLKNYETESRLPNSEALALLVSYGLNANWLLAGIGPQLLSDLEAKPAGIDKALLGEVLAGVEQGLAEAGLVMEPSKKAELISAVYDMYAEAGTPPTSATILKFVRAAA